MKNLFKPRKKKLHGPYIPIEGKKIVRIDARTEIEVNISIPDDIARERFLARAKAYMSYGQRTPTIIITPHLVEVPVGDILELATIEDDSEEE
jgi:hypothetical protein